MPDQRPNDRPEGRGVFTGCLFSVGLALAIVALIALFRWLG